MTAARHDEGGPFDTVQKLMAFLVAAEYGHDTKRGFELHQGGRDYLLCAIAVDVAALRREAVQATKGTEA